MVDAVPGSSVRHRLSCHRRRKQAAWRGHVGFIALFRHARPDHRIEFPSVVLEGSSFFKFLGHSDDNFESRSVANDFELQEFR